MYKMHQYGIPGSCRAAFWQNTIYNSKTSLNQRRVYAGSFLWSKAAFFILFIYLFLYSVLLGKRRVTSIILFNCSSRYRLTGPASVQNAGFQDWLCCPVASCPKTTAVSTLYPSPVDFSLWSQLGGLGRVII